MHDRNPLVGEKVVVRYSDGSLVKGYTFDFSPRSRKVQCFPTDPPLQQPARLHRGHRMARLRPMPESRPPRQAAVARTARPAASRGSGVELPGRLLAWLLPKVASGNGR